jgi:hypothetical protein
MMVHLIYVCVYLCFDVCVCVCDKTVPEKQLNELKLKSSGVKRSKVKVGTMRTGDASKHLLLGYAPRHSIAAESCHLEHPARTLLSRGGGTLLRTESERDAI